MSIPTSHILPNSTFRHIGFMVLFMSIMAGFSILGLLSIQTITKEWLDDIANKMSIEIPAFDEARKNVLEQDQMEETYHDILSLLDNDPLITKIDTFRPDGLQAANNEFSIPAPIFMTLSLHPDRAENSENRLAALIIKHHENIEITAQTDWHSKIVQTSNTLRFAFISLTVSIFIITIIVISAAIRTQLKASADTIHLIYLMGASANTISGLFQRALLRPVLIACTIGLMCVGLGLSPALTLLNISISPLHFYGYLGVIFGTFFLMGTITASLTVHKALKKLP